MMPQPIQTEHKPLSMAASRLCKHADYQRVYKQGRKQFSQQMAYFYALRSGESLARAKAGPRVGLTVGKVLGKAVDRNRIKRRMREAVRHHLAELTAPVDVVLHPRKSVQEMEFAALEREVSRIFAQIQRATAEKIPAGTGKKM
ncbi:MAG: ribonuclease P protein component [Acidobacteriaceae bacterium]